MLLLLLLLLLPDTTTTTTTTITTTTITTIITTTITTTHSIAKANNDTSRTQPLATRNSDHCPHTIEWIDSCFDRYMHASYEFLYRKVTPCRFVFVKVVCVGAVLVV